MPGDHKATIADKRMVDAQEAQTQLKGPTVRHGSERSPYTFVETPAVVLKILEDVSSSDDEEENGLEDSIGRFIWPAAVPMLRHMLLPDDDSTTTKNYLKKTSSVIIVELGAGCGVLGMGLAVATTNNHLILTDHDSDWLQRNLALNEPLLLREEDQDAATTIEVAKLDWREPQDIAMVRKKIEEKIATLSVDNSIDEVELMIVGSDILYNHESHKSLATTLHQLSHKLPAPMKQPIRILLGFPDRDDDEQHFMPIARECFGDTLIPPSKPIIDNRKTRNKKGNKMDLGIIEFNVDHS